MRFDNLNLLRAFAALAVVVYHVIEKTQWTAFPIEGPLLTFRIGWVGVDLFFIISGFVIAYSALLLYRKQPTEFAGSYWRRRLTRILPLYLLTMVLWIVLAWPDFFKQPASIWAWHLFTHLAFIHSFWTDTHGSIDGANWSLALEMQFYLAVALLIRWIDRTPGWRIWLYCTLIAWAWRACMLVLYGNGEVFPLFAHVTQLPGTLDEFGAGIFLAKWVLEKRARNPWQGLLWAAAACVVGYYCMGHLWSQDYWVAPHMVVLWRTSLAVFLVCVLAAAIELPQLVSGKWLQPVNYLGEISYGIYLWHLFAIGFATSITGIAPAQVLIVTLALTLLAAACSWHYFEKPLMNTVKR
ncbi:acyltransferase [Chitinimonas arctica]|uniref:Acyltransferase n=1 Tax=Chitinimonas arctica TaxID=2594795 RepID=A0A516SGH8_9NEIS|nr:acyltransferase [Chitinimonas arctica]QDQ27263.1 acyltransferase [Chitinimonas arctica]